MTHHRDLFGAAAPGMAPWAEEGLTLKEAIQELYEESRRMRDLQQEIAKWYTTILLTVLAALPVFLKEFNVRPMAPELRSPQIATTNTVSASAIGTASTIASAAASKPAVAVEGRGLRLDIDGFARGWALVSTLLTIVVILHVLRLNWRFGQMQEILKANDPLTPQWRLHLNKLDKTGGYMHRLMSALPPHLLTCLSMGLVGIVGPWAVVIRAPWT